MSRLGGAILDRLSRPDDVDQEAEELWRAARRERLCADLRRVERLIATDTWMSATRQRGNRLAYQQLLDDLRHTPDVLPAIPGMSSGPRLWLWLPECSEDRDTRDRLAALTNVWLSNGRKLLRRDMHVGAVPNLAMVSR